LIRLEAMRPGGLHEVYDSKALSASEYSVLEKAATQLREFRAAPFKNELEADSLLMAGGHPVFDDGIRTYDDRRPIP
jgi:hypothetical protein